METFETADHLKLFTCNSTRGVNKLRHFKLDFVLKTTATTAEAFLTLSPSQLDLKLGFLSESAATHSLLSDERNINSLQLAF